MTIDFDGQPNFRTIEIQDVGTDWVLLAKVTPFELAFAQ
jgi:hypothetical protein